MTARDVASSSLPDRPAVGTPDSDLHPAVRAAVRRRSARQPLLGLAGLLLVLPVAALLAFAVDGAEGSVRVLGPLATFALVPVAIVAFWWEDWPGTMHGPSWWSGWFNTAIIAALAVLLTILGQAIAGGVDFAGIFDPTPGHGHAPTHPAVLPLAGAAFAVMLQFTLVNEGWPLRRLPAIPAGLAAAVVAWLIALALYLTLVKTESEPGSGLSPRDGPVAAPTFAAVLTCIGAWQVWLFVAWQAWPFATISSRPVRLVTANVVTVAGGWLTYLGVRQITHPPTITALAGCVIAAGLTISMLFEGSLRYRLPPVWDRVSSVLVIAAVAAALYSGLAALAPHLGLTTITTPEWVTHASLNAIALSIILHVAVGRRWPFGDNTHPS